MLSGVGYHFLAFILTIFTLIVLSLFGNITYLIEKLHHSKTVMITFKNSDIKNLYLLEEIFKNNKIKSRRLTMSKKDDKIFATFSIRASQKLLSKVDEELIRMENIVDYY